MKLINILKKYIHKDCLIHLPTITRVELIDETGRLIIKHNVECRISIQDNERTLKVFIKQMK
jgi:hypothetical protein